MKAEKFFELNNEELNNKLNELKAELFNLRFKHATNQLSNPMVLVNCKKDIAKVKTIQRQREIGIDNAPKVSNKKVAR